WRSRKVTMATPISLSPPTAKHGWAFWRRNAILFGLCCAEKSGSRDHRDCCWLLENASRRDLYETRNGGLQLIRPGCHLILGDTTICRLAGPSSRFDGRSKNHGRKDRSKQRC